MIIRAFAVIAVLGLAMSQAVAQSASPTMAPLPKQVKTTYSCHNHVVAVTYDNVKDRASIRYGGHEYLLPRVMSADGARYMNDKLEWWSKGTGATLSSVSAGKAASVLASCQQIRP